MARRLYGFLSRDESLGVQIPFKTSYLSDPWNLPNLNDENSTGMAEPLSVVEVTYKAIQEITTDIESQTSEPEEGDLYYTSIWAIGFSN